MHPSIMSRSRCGGGCLALAFGPRLLTEGERQHDPEALLEQLHVPQVRLVRGVALCVALHLRFRGQAAHLSALDSTAAPKCGRWEGPLPPVGERKHTEAPPVERDRMHIHL